MLRAATSLARELADPIRLTALQLLAVEGPHTMSQLASALRISPPRLGNHLARLRAAGLVAVEQRGRHAFYQLAAAGIDDVLTALSRHGRRRAAPAPADRAPASSVPSVSSGPSADLARTCYDHPAGRLGVAVFGMLVARGALRPPDGRGAEVALGTDQSAFADLGVKIATIAPGRRKLATACLDRSHRLPHLGGLLGAAVLDAILAEGLVAREDGSRVLTITARGAERLPALLPDFAGPPATAGPPDGVGIRSPG